MIPSHKNVFCFSIETTILLTYQAIVGCGVPLILHSKKAFSPIKTDTSGRPSNTEGASPTVIKVYHCRASNQFGSIILLYAENS